MLKFFVPIGRLFYSFIFIVAAINHFSPGTVAYAASQGIPYASTLVPLTGIIILLGGLSILLGYKARAGACLIAFFLIPTTLSMHRFWAETNAAQAMIQQIMFMKNLSMLGGAFLIAYFGSGPFSLDNKK